MEYTTRSRNLCDQTSGRHNPHAIIGKKCTDIEVNFSCFHNSHSIRTSPKVVNIDNNNKIQFFHGKKICRQHPSTLKNSPKTIKNQGYESRSNIFRGTNSRKRNLTNVLCRPQHSKERKMNIENSMLIEKEETMHRINVHRESHRSQSQSHKRIKQKRQLEENEQFFNDSNHKQRYDNNKVVNIEKTKKNIKGEKENYDDKERIEIELKRLKQKNNYGHKTQLNKLFDEIIISDKSYGKALNQIKEIYESKMSQLNKRIANHEEKTKDYKKEIQRQKIMREKQERLNESMKSELKKQTYYIKSQKGIIKNLKERLENQKHFAMTKILVAENLNLQDKSKERIKVEVPPLDLSKVKQNDPLENFLMSKCYNKIDSNNGDICNSKNTISESPNDLS